MYRLKKSSLTILLILTCFVANAQKTKITTTDGGLVLRNNVEYSSGITISKSDLGSDEYVLAVKSGYATQAVKLDSVVNANNTQYQIKLQPLESLDPSKVKAKIIFSGLVDKLHKIKLIEYLTGYTYQYADFSSSEYKEDISSLLVERKFNVIEQNDVFKSKVKEVDYALAGEIMEYKKGTKGPGFIATVIIRWSLYDVQAEKTVYKITTGGYSNTQTKMTEKEVLKLAFKDALNTFTINKEVIKYMYESELGAVLNSNVIIIPKVLRAENINSNFTEKAMQASVTIKSSTGHGSGFLISSNGYLLTNYHVIADSTELQVIFQNGLILPLQILAFDKKNDVALCKIPGKGYNVLPMDTNSVIKKIGSDVLAIGTPQDIKLGQTITKGIISGLREIKGNSYIQTDVSINSGNSGGMLINKDGDVIGIVSAKIKGEGIEGLGFAIPIARAINALNLKLAD